MNAEGFIAKRLRFKGKMAIAAVAISLFIIILALAISDGFRHEIRKGLASVSGDIVLTDAYFNYFNSDSPIRTTQSYMDQIMDVSGIESVSPVIYRAGIIKSSNGIHGVIFKGTPGDTVSMQIRIPESLAAETGAGPGDELVSYFISSRTRIRKFRIAGTYTSSVDAGNGMIVYLPLSDMQRLNGWNEDECSSLEIMMGDEYRSKNMLEFKAQEIGSICTMAAGDDDDVLVATPSTRTFSQLFDWLDLIDFNVYTIIMLMMTVAGFNMISGLLIMMFRNIRTIGILKAVGMGDKAIGRVFLRIAARIALTGGAAGNLAAIGVCLIQKATHVITLNPENYFVSFVPIYMNTAKILLVDAISFAVILLLMLIPAMFISKVDPSLTVKSE